jgi:glycosyltransferase involved in cell wall biosynthesis
MDLSIIITTYNYENYLIECIDSCLEQLPSGINYEIVVVDDGSTDGTHEVLSKGFPKILRAYHIKNSGIERASNFGFLKAKGKYLVRVDADDLLKPNFCQAIEKYLSSDFGFYYSNYHVIDADSEVIEKMKLPKFSFQEIASRGDFLATGTIYNASLIKFSKGYSTDNVNSGLENYEFILDLIQRGVKGFHIPETLFCYRRHSMNLSMLKTQQIINNGRDLFLEKQLGEFTTNKYHPYGLEV